MDKSTSIPNPGKNVGGTSITILVNGKVEGLSRIFPHYQSIIVKRIQKGI